MFHGGARLLRTVHQCPAGQGLRTGHGGAAGQRQHAFGTGLFRGGGRLQRTVPSVLPAKSYGLDMGCLAAKSYGLDTGELPVNFNMLLEQVCSMVEDCVKEMQGEDISVEDVSRT